MKRGGLYSLAVHASLKKNFPLMVVTHAVDKREKFISIIKSKKINLPASLKDTMKRTPYMERVLGINNCVYLSLGFVYNKGVHNWPYAFIFKKSILAQPCVRTYKAFLISRGWMRLLRRLRDNDPTYLTKIASLSQNARREINSFIKSDMCKWWEIESELSKSFEDYPLKQSYIKEIRKTQKKVLLSNSYAPRYLTRDYLADTNIKKFEAVSFKPISLYSPYFVGVYVAKPHLSSLLPALKRMLPTRALIFDGKKVYYGADNVRI